MVSDTRSYEVRFEQFFESIQTIRSNFLTGVGFHHTSDGLTLHNLIVSNWAYNGIIGLIVAAGLYIAVAGKFVHFYSTPEYRIYSVLFLLFLVKTMLGGNTGFPEPSAIIAIGIAMNLYRNNRL